MNNGELSKDTVNYQFGYYVGETIINKYLPVTSVDMIKTNTIISTTYGEYKKHKKLDDIWFENQTDENWKAVNDYYHFLSKKYLPEKLVCFFPILNITDYDEFVSGLITSLWNSDVCHYSLNLVDIGIEDSNDFLYTKITFKLDS